MQNDFYATERRHNRRSLLILAAIVFLISVLWLSIGKAQATTFLNHPAGCPRVAFCGCGAAVEVGYGPRRDLWPSSAWPRKFPRTNPAPQTVAYRRGHVFVLKRHISGKTWLVADYNSGGHRSRLHPRSIAGYIIVDPRTHIAAGK